ncbi:AAA family ATPase [Rhizobium laguerreae]|uniref:AAA family ATPase n=1 Tax=Rhizobium laguerreae TaxID=1076926 RepID=UPI0014412565|nr:AAA family ATPase [Rhizobium laguerreae]NKN08621.1 AAA family ATPase [Rhizobium laguerreae]
MHKVNSLIGPSVDAASLANACETYRLPLDLLSQLLTVRKRFEGGGNRRRLYQAFDTLLTGEASENPTDVSSSSEQVHGHVSLRQLAFKNWKVFASTAVSFPDFDPSEPVVLIGGKNGYGKTSLLEGILYCLFGKSALSERSRLLGEANVAGARGSAYRQFIQNAFHRPGKDRGETSASVRTEWNTPDGILVVERRWYFDDVGDMHEDDETLTLFTGADYHIMPVPDGAEAVEFYQSEIERRLMTVGSAFFVLFDAEQTSAFSEKNLDEQVRAVTEGAFGLWQLRATVDNLRSYSRDRARRQDRQGNEQSKVVSRLLELRQDENRLDQEKARVSGLLDKARAERDDGFSQLVNLQGDGTFASMHELLEQRQALSLEQARMQHEYTGLAASTLPIALAGDKLKASLLSALAADDHREDGTSTSFQNQAVLERLLQKMEELGGKSPDARPQIEQAWHALAGSHTEVSAALNHPFLTPSMRVAVRERLQRHRDDFAIFADVSAKLSGLVAQARETEEAIQQSSRRDEEIAQTKLKLTALHQKVEELERELDTYSDRSVAIEAEISCYRAMLDGDDQDGGDATVNRRPVDYALGLADKIELVSNELLPGCFERVSAIVTDIYAALAHKGSIARIEISSDGKVLLFDRGGKDVRSLDRSAGERQIFAMALIAAIGNLSTVSLPSIIDTPLGRLDSDHRERLLLYFSSRNVQTILLSQPEEINGRYLDLIRKRIGGYFLLDHHEVSNGVGSSVATSGYFNEVAA